MYDGSHRKKGICVKHLYPGPLLRGRYPDAATEVSARANPYSEAQGTGKDRNDETLRQDLPWQVTVAGVYPYHVGVVNKYGVRESLNYFELEEMTAE